MKMEVKMAELEREREEMHKTLGVNPNPEEASKAVLAANDKFYEVSRPALALPCANSSTLVVFVPGCRLTPRPSSRT